MAGRHRSRMPLLVFQETPRAAHTAASGSCTVFSSWHQSQRRRGGKLPPSSSRLSLMVLVIVGLGWRSECWGGLRAERSSCRPPGQQPSSRQRHRHTQIRKRRRRGASRFNAISTLTRWPIPVQIFFRSLLRLDRGDKTSWPLLGLLRIVVDSRAHVVILVKDTLVLQRFCRGWPLPWAVSPGRIRAPLCDRGRARAIVTRYLLAHRGLFSAFPTRSSGPTSTSCLCFVILILLLWRGRFRGIFLLLSLLHRPTPVNRDSTCCGELRC